MEYLSLFLLLAAVLIAAWFYLQRAKARGGRTDSNASVTATTTDPGPDEVR